MASFHLPKYPFVVQDTCNLSEGLQAIEKTNGYPIVVVDYNGSLLGILSSGDVARYLQKVNKVDLSACKLSEVVNKCPITGHHHDSIETVKEYLSSPYVRTLPIINSQRKLIKVITSSDPSIAIGKYLVGKNKPPFLIAEIGVNHNGDIKEAKKLMEAAYKSGCQAIKFQHRSQSLYTIDDLDSYDLGTQYIISEIERTRLSIDELRECCHYAKGLELEVIITPFDEVALGEIEIFMKEVSALKIASCDLTNIDLINSCIKFDKPLIVSTGMSYEHEIISTSQFLLSKMCEHAFLHCCSTYPAPGEDINLAYLDRLFTLTDAVVGYSSHDGNSLIPCLAVARGSEILEFHITSSQEEKGTDHKASIPIDQLVQFTKMCKLSYISRGTNKPRKPSQGELANKMSLGKSYAMKSNKQSGHILTSKDLVLVSPGIGYGPNEKNKLIGRRLIRDKVSRSILTGQDFENINKVDISELKSSLKSLTNIGYLIGIPVRYHDIKDLSEEYIMPLYEFHMSDRDLKLGPKDYLDERFKSSKLIIHAVEQFEDGFIFDLASSDSNIIQRSFKEIERLNNHISELRDFFCYSEKIPVVINVGGHSSYGFHKKDISADLLKTAVQNLDLINKKYKEVDFLPQTMPPYPWHQGGRSYHNILTNYNAIKDFLKISNSDLCFDVSHTYLSANHWGQDFDSYIELIGNRIRHVHLSDASGINGEGLQIGDGSIDFKLLHNNLKKINKSHLLVPEIWQGHLNKGYKFFQNLIRYDEIINHS